MGRVQHQISTSGEPWSSLRVRRQVVEPPRPCAYFHVIGLDALPQDGFVGFEHDVHHRVTACPEAPQQLIPVVLLEDRLGGNETLSAEPDQLVGHERRQDSPGFPVPEVSDRVIGEMGSQHEAHRLRIEGPEPGAPLRQQSSRGRLAGAECSVEPDDHDRTLPSATHAQGTRESDVLLLGLLRPEVDAGLDGVPVDLGELVVGQGWEVQRVEVGVELLDARRPDHG